jgi:hypothetical protein
MPGEWDARRQMAELSLLLPPPKSPARSRTRLRRIAGLARLRRRSVSGLEGIPERYRLQFLVLAAGKLPGATPEQVRDLADKLASHVIVPERLAAKLPGDPKPLDAWFRGQMPVLTAALDDLRVALWAACSAKPSPP